MIESDKKTSKKEIISSGNLRLTSLKAKISEKRDDLHRKERKIFLGLIINTF